MNKYNTIEDRISQLDASHQPGDMVECQQRLHLQGELMRRARVEWKDMAIVSHETFVVSVVECHMRLWPVGHIDVVCQPPGQPPTSEDFQKEMWGRFSAFSEYQYCKCVVSGQYPSLLAAWAFAHLPGVSTESMPCMCWKSVRHYLQSLQVQPGDKPREFKY